MAGRALQRLYLLAEDQYGFFTTREAASLGIRPGAVTKMAARDQIKQVHRGVYRLTNFPRSPFDQYVAATLWPVGVRGVLSHESALELYGLSDVNPSRIHITVPSSHRVRRTVPELYVVHRADLNPEESLTYEGVPVVIPVRAIEESIADGLRDDLLIQALDTARDKGFVRESDDQRLRDLLAQRRTPEAATP
jgi:predicted transcriptional regulator of viral defense system